MTKRRRDDNLTIRFTDQGAVAAISMTVDTLTYLNAILVQYEMTSVQELVDLMKGQLGKYLMWLDRTPDSTLYQKFTKSRINALKKDARLLLKQPLIPPKEYYLNRKRMLDKLDEEEKIKPESSEDPVSILLDTSIYLAYLAKDKQYHSINAVVQYLRSQKSHYVLFMPDIVSLELISQLVRRYPFKKAVKSFYRLLDELTDGNLGVNTEQRSIHSLFERYETFARKDLAKQLRGNDFLVATEGVLSGSIILTCDVAIHREVNKFYRNIFLINESPKSYMDFFKTFERKKPS